MPKILRIINRFNLGGLTYNAAYLTKYLSPSFETLLIGGKKEEDEESSLFILDKMGIKPVIIPEMRRSINPLKDKIVFTKISNIIKKFKPDIVHTHASKAGAIGRLAAIRNKVPVIVHTFHGHVFHSYFNKSKTLIFKIIERQLAARSNKIIAISNQQKYELSKIHKICPSDKIEVIPLGFELNKFQENFEQKRKNFRKKYRISDDEIAIGIIGRLVPVKNHELFLRALHYVKQNTDKKIRAFIIGDGILKNDLIKLTQDLSLDWTENSVPYPKKSFITFTSWSKNIEEIYPGLDIVALTSKNEGTPVSIIEAQASNRPVISTDVGGVRDTILENKTGIVTSQDKFCEKLLTLINNDQLRDKLSKNGYNFVMQKFNYLNLVEKTKILYNQLLSQL